MISEAEFQAALDAQPDDHTTRLVFADWLDEHGDPRADGYRALAVNQWWPNHMIDCFWYDASGPYGPLADRPASAKLPSDIYQLLLKEAEYGSDHGCVAFIEDRERPRKNRKSRRKAENGFARAFLNLPAERRAELLAPVKAVPA